MSGDEESHTAGKPHFAGLVKHLNEREWPALHNNLLLLLLHY